MIAIPHPGAWFDLHIQLAGGVGQQYRSHPQQFQYPNWKCDLLQRVSFVVMKAALHRRDRYLTDFAKDQTTSVTFDCRSREAGDFVIRNLDRIGQVVSESAEPAAEDDCYRHFGVCAHAKGTRSFLCALVKCRWT